jgi:hypothetical protein
MTGDTKLVTAVFRDRLDAEQAFDFLYSLGYRDSDINVLMSDAAHSAFTQANKPEPPHRASDGVMEGVAVGGGLGITLGAAVAGIAAIGTSLAIPGLGLVVAGPIAAALAGAGAGAVTGGTIGALIGLGVTQPNAEAYTAALRNGGIVLGVRPRNSDDASRIEEKFKELHGENVCYC